MVTAGLSEKRWKASQLTLGSKAELLDCDPRNCHGLAGLHQALLVLSPGICTKWGASHVLGCVCVPRLPLAGNSLPEYGALDDQETDSTTMQVGDLVHGFVGRKWEWRGYCYPSSVGLFIPTKWAARAVSWALCLCRRVLHRLRYSWTSRGKAAHTKKAKQRINSQLLMGKQVFCHLQENRAPSHVVVMWADKHHHSNSLPSSFLPQLYVLSMMPHG